MELKEMLLKRKVEPIYEPNDIRQQQQNARVAPPKAPQKQFKSKERLTV